MVTPSNNSNNNQNSNSKLNSSYNTNSNNTQDHSKINVTPAQAIVIGGIITGVLDIFSFLIDVNQNVEITLVGNLKQDIPKKHDINSMLDSLGPIPLDDILKAIINRLS